MGKPKKAATPPTAPGTRVLRTSTEIAEWMFRRLEWPRRLAQYEAAARRVLSRTPDPQYPRHKHAVGILSLITAAKVAQERGEPADSLMVAIEHQRAVRFDPSRRPTGAKWDDRLQALMEQLVRDTLTIQAKDMLDALGALAAPDDPTAVIARREALRLYWRPQPDEPERPLSLSALRTRLTWIKAHLADS